MGVPTVLDRFIQQALLPVLRKSWDPTFSECSYGFRPGSRLRLAVSPLMFTAAIEVVSPVVSTPVGDLRNRGFSKFPLIRQLNHKGYARRFRMAFVDQHEALVFFEPSQPFPVCRVPLRRSGAVKIERGSDWFPVA